MNDGLHNNNRLPSPMPSSMLCRYCHESSGSGGDCSGSEEPLLAPCACRGTLKFVHASCLRRWLIQERRDSCELCGCDLTDALPYTHTSASAKDCLWEVFRRYVPSIVRHVVSLLIWAVLVPLTTLVILRCAWVDVFFAEGEPEFLPLFPWRSAPTLLLAIGLHLAVTLVVRGFEAASELVVSDRFLGIPFASPGELQNGEGGDGPREQHEQQQQDVGVEDDDDDDDDDDDGSLRRFFQLPGAIPDDGSEGAGMSDDPLGDIGLRGPLAHTVSLAMSGIQMNGVVIWLLIAIPLNVGRACFWLLDAHEPAPPLVQLFVTGYSTILVAFVSWVAYCLIPGTVSRSVHAAVVRHVRRAQAVFKVVFLLALDFLFLPMALGFVVHLLSLKLTGSSLAAQLVHLHKLPFVALTNYFTSGWAFQIGTAQLGKLLRETVRRDVLSRILDYPRGDADPLLDAEVMHGSLWGHLWRSFCNLCVYVWFVFGGVFIPGEVLSRTVPGALPLRFGETASNPLIFVLVHVLVMWGLYFQFNIDRIALRMIQRWFAIVMPFVGLSKTLLHGGDDDSDASSNGAPLSGPRVLVVMVLFWISHILFAVSLVLPLELGRSLRPAIPGVLAAYDMVSLTLGIAFILLTRKALIRVRVL